MSALSRTKAALASRTAITMSTHRLRVAGQPASWQVCVLYAQQPMFCVIQTVRIFMVEFETLLSGSSAWSALPLWYNCKSPDPHQLNQAHNKWTPTLRP